MQLVRSVGRTPARQPYLDSRGLEGPPKHRRLRKCHVSLSRFVEAGLMWQMTVFQSTIITAQASAATALLGSWVCFRRAACITAPLRSSRLARASEWRCWAQVADGGARESATAHGSVVESKGDARYLKGPRP